MATMSREPLVVTVDEAGVGMRLDRFLAERMPGMSRSRLSALIREGAILVNDRIRPNRAIRSRLGDRIEIRVPEARPAEAQPQEIALGLLYEDDDLAVLDKASGMVVHPGAGHDDGTLVNALLHRYGPLSTIGGVQRPGIVHRLDKETSGCLVVARNDFTHTALARQFAGRQTRKVYLAVVQGIPTPSSGRIENQLGAQPGPSSANDRGRSRKRPCRSDRLRGDPPRQRMLAGEVHAAYRTNAPDPRPPQTPRPSHPRR